MSCPYTAIPVGANLRRLRGDVVIFVVVVQFSIVTSIKLQVVWLILNKSYNTYCHSGLDPESSVVARKRSDEAIQTICFVDTGYKVMTDDYFMYFSYYDRSTASKKVEIVSNTSEAIYNMTFENVNMLCFLSTGCYCIR